MLVNGIYDPQLFGLRFTDDPEQSSGPFWSSAIRPAAVHAVTGAYLPISSGGVPTSEYLEIDYGRIRQVMGLMMDIIRLPFDITIEYDALSGDDGEHVWLPVTPEPELQFDDMILYEANATSSFAHSEYYFSDAKGETLHTRYLRITFRRRDTPWPTRDSSGRAYPAIVRNLRTFRSVSDHRHMAGPLFVSDPDTNVELLALNAKADLTTHELTQRFVFPEDATRGEGTATTGDDIIPALLGFSFLAEVPQVEGVVSDSSPGSAEREAAVKWRWSLWDVTGDDATELDHGLVTGAAHSGRCWINCYFNRPIPGGMETTYEIRLSSRYTPASPGVYVSHPVDVPGFIVPSTFSAERRSKLLTVDNTDAGVGLLEVGNYIQAIDGLRSYRVRSIGQPGGYVSFDGNSGRIDVAYDAALATADWATHFWYRTEAEADGVVSILIDNADFSGNGWYVGIGPDGGSLDSALQVTCAGTTLFDTSDTADGEWHHGIIAYDDGTGTLELYRDNELVDSATGLTYTPNPGNDLCFGTKWGTDWDNLEYGAGPWTVAGTRYEGDLDDVAIHDAALDASAVADIYDVGHGGSTGVAYIQSTYSSLLAFWQFNDDVDSDTAIDEEGSFDGSVVPLGVTFTGEADDELVIEVDRGWREETASRRFFIVPRLTYVADNEYSADHSRSLVLRVWSDTGDSGRDILGNRYRYATRLLDSASRVLDPDSPGWMSAPRPSPEAVESLYFDVRQSTTGSPQFAVIDNIRIAPRTHGVRMHVYYTRDNLHGEAPKLTDHWDQMLWTPVNEVYTLRRDEAIQLPHGIQASYIKLEFTNLRPLPFAMSPFPELPPVEFKRHPTWVENAFENTKIRRTVEDWFIQTETPVQRRVLKEIADPINEFAYKHREFMTALSQGLITDSRVLGSGLIDNGTGAFIDPVTSAKIRFASNTMYRGSLVATLRDESLLGQAMRSRPTAAEPFARELQPVRERRSAFVSTLGDRVTHSFSEIAETPMWFNRRCRHFYRIDKARFNRKGFYVGIRDVEFRRNDYAVEFDDPIIDDNLYDDQFLEINSFVRDSMSRIEDGQTVYVSYWIGDTEYADEIVELNATTFVDLVGTGEVATDIRVHSAPGEAGTQYDLETDFVVSNAYEVDGDITTQIARSDLTEYLEVDPSVTAGLTYRDSGTAAGYGTALDEEDAG